MKLFFLFCCGSLLLTACGNSGSKTTKTFCDTTCQKDSFKFTDPSRFKPTVTIGIKDCAPDTLTWTHERMDMSRQRQMTDYLGQSVRLNPSNINCVFKDTSYAWLTFNDCITGRGYLLKLSFAKHGEGFKSTSALNSFDPKFVVAPDLRAYTDRGNIFVIDVNSDKVAQMSFKEPYDMDFNKIHDAIDSINVSHKHIYVKLLKEGKEIPMEKNIDM